jgi:hypothetical protein
MITNITTLPISKQSRSVHKLYHARKVLLSRVIIVIYIISGIKAILQDSSVKIADDEDVSPSSSVTHEFPVRCFSPRVMYNILSTAANY